jgi:ribosomal protein S12 methylthiotransferase accessory factor
MTTAASRKGHRAGTHRVCSPAETLTRITPLLPHFGITRLADITQLDRLGIPVYQAIRPSTRNLSVSQGKGLTADAAKVSALMESIEVWHAERIESPGHLETVERMQGGLDYEVRALTGLPRGLLDDGTTLDWLPAVALVVGEPTHLPYEFVTLDFRVSERPARPLFRLSSTGLASGNTWEEAALHGLCEVIERDSVMRFRYGDRPQDRSVNADRLTGEAPGLVDRVRSAGARLDILDLTGPAEVPCFEARLFMNDLPLPAAGHGCHPDPDVALCRAITEAAQSRLTNISGARDDLPPHAPVSFASLSMPVPDARTEPAPIRDTTATDDIAADLEAVAVATARAFGGWPIAVDLTRPEFGIAVAKVAVPGCRDLLEPGNWFSA